MTRTPVTIGVIAIVALLARCHVDNLITATLGRFTICRTTITIEMVFIITYLAKRTINYAIATFFCRNAGGRTTVAAQHVGVVAHLTELNLPIATNRHTTRRAIAKTVTERRQCTRGAFGGAHAGLDSLGRCTPCRHANAAFCADKLRAN